MIRLPRPVVNSVCHKLVVALILMLTPLLAPLLAPSAFTHLFAVSAADRGTLEVGTFNAFPDLAAVDTHAVDTVSVDTVFAARGQGQNAPNCLEFVSNGGFEQTSVGWQPTANSSLFTYAEDQFVGGRQSLYLGFATPVNLPATFGVEQLVTLPAESRAIEFSFYYALVMEGVADPGDQAYLTLTDVTDNRTLAMLVLSPTANVTANVTGNVTETNTSAVVWSMGRYDLTPLAGKSLRLAFLVENDGGENDGGENDSAGNTGESGKLTMRIDDVSIMACLPPESLALEALPTPTPTIPPPSPEPLTLAPVISPTASVTSPPVTTPPITTTTPRAAVPQASPAVAASPSGLPETGSITSLDACNCSSSLYACTNFSSWAVAQACYTRCQVTAGYDIHNLDPDKNGIACELELQDVASLEAPPSPQPTPLIPDTTSISPSASTSGTVDAPLAAPVAAVGGMTDTSTTGGTQMTTTQSATVTMTGAISPVVDAVVDAVAATTSVPASNLATPTSQDGAALTPLEMLTLLLFSPMGYVALGVLIVIGALCLWLAYLLGKRDHRERQESAKPNNVPDDFTLQPKNEVSAPKL